MLRYQVLRLIKCIPWQHVIFPVFFVDPDTFTAKLSCRCLKIIEQIKKAAKYGKQEQQKYPCNLIGTFILF